ncbi:MAG: VWA domain-containing protein [Campylobacterota bacterium]
MFDITYPLVLYLLGPVVLLFIYLLATNKTAYARVFDQKVLRRLLVRGRGLSDKARRKLLYAAMILIVLALSRPVYLAPEQKAHDRPPAVVLALDVSTSMRSRDLYPNRLAFAKKKMADFIKAGGGREIGILVFAKNTYLLAPLTTSYDVLLQKLQTFELQDVERQNADVGKAIARAEELLQGRGRDVVLFTSGDYENQNPQKALEQAGTKVHALICASRAGAPLLDANNQTAGKAWSKPREAFLRQLGEFSYADHSPNLAQSLYAAMQEHGGLKARYQNYPHTELFVYPLWGALLLAFLSFFDPRVTRKSAVLCALVLTAVSKPVQAFDCFDLQKARSAYENQQFEKAIQAYKDVAQSAKRDYNIANGYYKLGAYEKALTYYKSVDTGDARLYQKLQHNLGNTYFQQEKYDLAVKHYQNALDISRDEATRKNLELAQKRLQKKRDKQQQSDKPSAGADTKKGSDAAKKPKSSQRVQTQKPGSQKGKRREYKKYEKMIDTAPAQLILLK